MLALQPMNLGGLQLRNRIWKTATFEGHTPGGQVTPALIRFHGETAATGVAVSTVAYGAVQPRGRTFRDQLLLDDDTARQLRALTNAVHREGAAAGIQLAHCGGFSRAHQGYGPSPGWNTYGILSGYGRIKPFTLQQLDDLVDDYVAAARRAVAAGFDVLEIHCGHGYLLSQFLSPLFNKRQDAYGGSAEARAHLPARVVRAVRDAVPPTVAVTAKLNTEDGVRGGFELQDAILTAKALERAGVDAIIPSGGLVMKTPFFLLRGDAPVAEMAKEEQNALQSVLIRMVGPVLLKAWPFQSRFFREPALAIRDAVDIPVGYLGGIDSGDAIESSMSDGFGFAVAGRALLADPDFIQRLQRGESWTSRCTRCNLCIARMDQGIRCHI